LSRLLKTGVIGEPAFVDHSKPGALPRSVKGAKRRRSRLALDRTGQRANNPDRTNATTAMPEIMMRTINISAAKTQFSRLVDSAIAGEEIVITRSGKPVARLVPLSNGTTPGRRQLGILGGKLTAADGSIPILAQTDTAWDVFFDAPGADMGGLPESDMQKREGF
jgi:prevent-host-death family protein